MDAHKTAPRASDDIEQVMLEVGRNARAGANALAIATTEQKNAALGAAANSIRANSQFILNANGKDLQAARNNAMAASLIDRLMLDLDRIEAIAKGIEAIAELPDPVGEVIAEWRRPNGLEISRVRTPLGVIGIIYESRPNVTADAGALCLKSGNAAILRGGSDSFHSSRAIHACLAAGFEKRRPPGSCNTDGSNNGSQCRWRTIERAQGQCGCDRPARWQKSR